MGLIFLPAVVAAHYLARLIFLRPWSFKLRMAILSVLIVASGLWAVHRVGYASYPLLGPAWVRESLDHLWRANLEWSNLSDDLKVFLLVIFLWWRGFLLAQRRFDSESITFRFRWNLVLLAASIILAGLLHAWPYQYFVFLFFFASLLCIALARAEEVAQQYGGDQAPFRLGWLAAVVLASLLVLTLAGGLALVLTGENVVTVLRPVALVLRFIILGVAYVIGWVIFLLLSLIFRLFLSDIDFELFEPEITPLVFDSPLETGPVTPLLTPQQLTLLRVGGVGVGILFVLLVVILTLVGLQARDEGREGSERESVWEGFRLDRGLGRWRQRLREAGAAVGDALAGRWLAALTIRRIYAQLCAWAARAGYPRARYETPYEYLKTLQAAFPRRRQDLARVTRAYVAVRYGEVPERVEELEAVREAWERIRRPAEGEA
jgi:hypothetical protein